MRDKWCRRSWKEDRRNNLAMMLGSEKVNPEGQLAILLHDADSQFDASLSCIILDFERSRNRDRTLSFFQRSGIEEMVSRCFHHQWRLKSDTGRNRTENPCVVSPDASPLRHGTTVRL